MQTLSGRPAPAYRRLAVATAVLVYLLIVMGGIVRVTGSGLGCADSWPSCNGSLLPSLTPTAVIEFLHRSITVLATTLVVVLLLATWLWQRRQRRLLAGASVAALLLLVQIALGAIAVKYSLPGGVVMIHLANALLVLAALVYVAVTATSIGREPGGDTRVARSLPLAGVAVVATYLLALSGALVVETGSAYGCNGWPLCGGGFQLPAAQMDVINMVHRVVAGVVVLALGALMGVLLRRHRERGGLRLWAMVVNVVIVLQVAMGAVVVDLRLPPAAQAVHLALATALWAAVLVVAGVILTAALPQERSEASAVSRLEPRRPTQAGAAS